jgi:ribosomal protein S18 acetylase RimI-like enzyme
VSSPRHISFNIRAATAGDTDFILSLVPRLVEFELPKGRNRRQCATAIRADIARALRDAPPSEAFFVAVNASGERAGFLRLQIQRDFFSGVRTCHVSDLVVAPRHDGEGIGRALLACAQRWAKRHRCKLLTLAVFPGNIRARALYERSGFTTDLLRMTKSLNS